MKVLITGTTQGIGKAIANKFLNDGRFEVYGIDIQPGSIHSYNYHHYVADISKKDQLPDFPFDFDIVINNAGVQNGGTGQYPVMDDIMSIYEVRFMLLKSTHFNQVSSQS